MANVEPNKIIYSMIGVGKYYDKKPVLKDIYLSYFYGAKIGVLGLNGSGKSSLLKIMAGIDKGFVGETTCSPGYTIGYLEQEPKLGFVRWLSMFLGIAGSYGKNDTVDIVYEYEGRRVIASRLPIVPEQPGAQ